MSVLREIIAHKKIEVLARRKNGLPTRESGRPRGFLDAVRSAEDVALIAEVKKASPSKGIIVEDFRPAEIALAYAEGGASCISVLTDERYFHGSLRDLAAVSEAVSLPVLRKDFIVDEFQVTESYAVGADCILLIVSALEDAQISDYIEMAAGMAMDALVEVHDENEMEVALKCGAVLIGVNNRDLNNFATDIATTERVLSRFRGCATFVSESAIWTRADVIRLGDAGAKAVLVGESLMRASDIAHAVRELLGK